MKQVAASMAGIAPIHMATASGTARGVSRFEAVRIPTTTTYAARNVAPTAIELNKAPPGSMAKAPHMPSGAQAATGNDHAATRAITPNPIISFRAATLTAAMKANAALAVQASIDQSVLLLIAKAAIAGTNPRHAAINTKLAAESV